ncbi:NEP1-interacting protein 2 [Trifolium repens]|nr:NEP1-interacting protein 2 [Trifolium repens]
MEFMANSCPLLDFFVHLVERVRWVSGLIISVIIGNIIFAIFTFFFAFVGTLLGAMRGALIGQETESGFIRGAAVGAVSGAVFSIEVFECSLDLWHSDQSGIGCLLYLIDVITNLLSGRLVREWIGPAMLSAVQSQMGANNELSFYEFQNIFDIGGDRGLSEFHVQFAFRISKLERQLEACLIVIICFTYLALTSGSSNMALAPLCRRDL